MTLGIIRDKTVALELGHYKSCDMDTGNPKYFGFMRDDGRWYIMRMANSDTELRYFAGDTDYTTNWTNRTSHAYDLISNIF